MKKRILTILSLVVVMALCLSQVALFGVSAEEAAVQKIQDKYTFLDDEVYYFRDAVETAIQGLETSMDDTTKMPQVYFDGDWTIGIQNYDPKSNVLPEPYQESFFYRQSNILGINMISSKVHKDLLGLRQSIGINVGNPEDKNLYFGMGTYWGFLGKYDVNFTAPHGGRIVLFDALSATIDALPQEHPWWSFEEKGTQQVGFSIWKNNTVKIWPLDADEVYVDKTTRSIPFPDAGEIKVKTGDVITLKISGQPGGVQGAVKLSPAVGYTEYIEDEPEIVEPPVDDTTSDTNSGTTGDGDGGLPIGLIIGIAAGAVVLVAAVVVIIIVVAKKKKGAAAIEVVAEDAVEESPEEKTEEKTEE